MCDSFTLYGNAHYMIDILESYIAYLQASGYDNSSPYYTHPDIQKCRNFLIQLNETSKFLEDD